MDSFLRQVGIKFGERIDPTKGSFLAFVTRLIRGGPAERAARISPGNLFVYQDKHVMDHDVRGIGLPTSLVAITQRGRQQRRRRRRFAARGAAKSPPHRTAGAGRRAGPMDGH